mmetsp:Transcript_36614/g.82998  ORF Transcript_36614/g.82998 Transcript_36614/m.82998 type:complete len:202 (+) Transcript_36614:186-791(+)
MECSLSVFCHLGKRISGPYGLRASTHAVVCGAKADEFNEGAEEPAEKSVTKILGMPQNLFGGGNAANESQPATEPVSMGNVLGRKFRLLFTCKRCDHKNSHMISRVAYHQGIVIATCPGCGVRHLISDKTGLLDYGLFDVEMLAKEGENVMRMGGDGFRQVTEEAVDAALPAKLNTLAERSSSGKNFKVSSEDGLTEVMPE